MNHYRLTDLQPDDAIETWDLNFRLGNAIKYIVRAKHKHRYSEDLIKAIWYLVKEVTGNTDFADEVRSSVIKELGMEEDKES
jgi:hypothetical protein